MKNLSSHISIDSQDEIKFSPSLSYALEHIKHLDNEHFEEIKQIYKDKIKLDELNRLEKELNEEKLASQINKFPLALTDMINKIQKESYSNSEIREANKLDDDDYESLVAKVDENNLPTFAIGNEEDTIYRKFLKHHTFLQHLIQSPFSDDARDYDDEAEAWSEQIWHRSYGTSDPKCPPSDIPCSGCGAIFHCCDPGLPGYVPKEVFGANVRTNFLDCKCHRCTFMDKYNVSLKVNVDRNEYANVISKIKTDVDAIVVVMVDLLDFPCSVWPGFLDLVGVNRPIMIVGNKLDLLPKDDNGYLDRIQESLRQNLKQMKLNDSNLNINELTVISAKTGFGVEGLVTRLLAYSQSPKNIYLVGCTNSGKSTLFNALLQSDLSTIRKGDILTRASTSIWPGTTLNLLKFPVAKLADWQLELRKRRLIRVERDKKRMERNVESTTRHRQAKPVHMSMLVERIRPTMITHADIRRLNLQPKFTSDHPLAKNLNDQIQEREPLSASKQEFDSHAFFYDTPGAVYADQIVDLLTAEEILRVIPRETIIPRTFSLRPLQSLFVSGLARLDLLTATSNVLITILASNYLPIHVVPTDQAERFYYTFLGTSYLGVPFGNAKRFEVWPELKHANEDFHFIQRDNDRKGVADIVLSSIGWALVSPRRDQECILRAFTPDGRGIYCRSPALLPFAVNLRGRKIKDTPCFVSKHFSIEQRRYGSARR